MKYTQLFVIFLVLIPLFSSVVSAGEGESNVQIIKTDGTKSTEGIEKAENFSKPSNEKDIPSKNETSSPSQTQIESAALAISQGNKDFVNWIPDILYYGGRELSSVGIDEENVTGSDSPKYTLYERKIDVFGSANVAKTLIITGILHVAVCMIFICLGVIRYSAQKVDPKKVSQVMAGFSGEESYWDIKMYIILVSAVMFLPFFDLFGIWYETFNRNIVVSYMITQMVDAVNTADMSLPTELIVNLSWFFTKVEEACGSYLLYLLTSLVIIKTWIQGVILFYGSLKKAAMVQAFFMVGFTLVLMMDVINMFLVSFGIDLGVQKSSPGYMMGGMITAALFDLFILLLVIGIPVIIVYTKVAYGRRW